jgi:hypothetical protein
MRGCLRVVGSSSTPIGGLGATSATATIVHHGTGGGTARTPTIIAVARCVSTIRRVAAATLLTTTSTSSLHHHHHHQCRMANTDITTIQRALSSNNDISSTGSRAASTPSTSSTRSVVESENELSTAKNAPISMNGYELADARWKTVTVLFGQKKARFSLRDGLQFKHILKEACHMWSLDSNAYQIAPPGRYEGKVAISLWVDDEALVQPLISALPSPTLPDGTPVVDSEQQLVIRPRVSDPAILAARQRAAIERDQKRAEANEAFEVSEDAPSLTGTSATPSEEQKERDEKRDLLRTKIRSITGRKENGRIMDLEGKFPKNGWREPISKLYNDDEAFDHLITNSPIGQVLLRADQKQSPILLAQILMDTNLYFYAKEKGVRLPEMTSPLTTATTSPTSTELTIPSKEPIAAKEDEMDISAKSDLLTSSSSSEDEEGLQLSDEPPSAKTHRRRAEQAAKLAVRAALKRQGKVGSRMRFDPDLQMLSNLSAPHEWYPAARKLKRRIHVHVGPTNSGKVKQHHHSFIHIMSTINDDDFHVFINRLIMPLNECKQLSLAVIVVHYDYWHGKYGNVLQQQVWHVI